MIIDLLHILESLGLIGCVLFNVAALTTVSCSGFGLKSVLVASYIIAITYLQAAFVFLRFVNQFSELGQLVYHAALSVVCIGGLRYYRVPKPDIVGTIQKLLRLPHAISEDPSLRILVIIFAASGSLLFFRTFYLPVLGWDWLTYHGLKAVTWMMGRDLSSLEIAGKWAAYQGLPAADQTVDALLMSFIRTDQLIGFKEFYEWVLLGIVLIKLGEQASLHPRAQLLVGMLVLSSRSVWSFVGSGYTDLSVSIALLSATIFVVEGRLWLGVFALANALLIKPTCILTVGFLGVFLFFSWVRQSRALSDESRKSLYRSVVVSGAISLLLAGGWVREFWQETGFPMGAFPARFGAFEWGRVPSETIFFLKTYAPLVGSTILSNAATLGCTFFAGDSPSFGIVIAFFAALGFCLFFYFLMRGDIYRELRVCFFCLIAGTVLFIFSSSFEVCQSVFCASNSRFFLPAVIPLIVVAFQVPKSWSLFTRVVNVAAYWGIIINLAGSIPYGWGAIEPVLLLSVAAVAIGCAALVYSLGRKYWGVPHRSHLLLGAAVGVIPIVLLTQLILRDVTKRWLIKDAFTVHSMPREWTTAVLELDRSAPKVVAATNGVDVLGHQQFFLPLLGNRFQHTLIYIPPLLSGNVAPQSPPFAAADEWSFDAWWGRLEKAKADYVFSFAPQTQELMWMEAAPHRFKRLSGDGKSWGFYQINAASLLEK
jgi:hypothetical protein